MSMFSYEEAVSQYLKDSPIPCDFKVGDKVSFTNDFGVKFGGHEIIGFSKNSVNYPERFIHLDKDSWWFPVSPSSLKKE